MHYSTVKNLLHLLPPETAHHLSLNLLSRPLTRAFAPVVSPKSAPIQVFGREFPNPIGLAAGFDKDGVAIEGLFRLGFGFIEVGTVTPKGQSGNSKPRLFRVKPARAIINRMGFNNRGVIPLVERLKQLNSAGLVGVNIGKNKETPLDRASEDYLFCLRAVHAYADYVTVNISSPNTPELRKLQTPEYLSHLLEMLQDEQVLLEDRHQRRVPLLVKIAPDLSQVELEVMIKTLLEHRIDGIIACNTTINHAAVERFKFGKEQGGVSGAPLRERSMALLKAISRLVDGAVPIISVGGIMSAEDATERLSEGATLVQLYSGLIYQGGDLVRQCIQALEL